MSGLITVDCPEGCDAYIQFVYNESPPERDIGWPGGIDDANQVDPCEVCGFKADRDQAMDIVERELEEVSHGERMADEEGDYLYQRLKEDGY